MTRQSLLVLGLVIGLVSALIFAGALSAAAVLFGDPRMIVSAPYLFALVLTLVGPVMLVCDLAGALIASLARQSDHSAQLVALIVAGCLGCAFVTARSGYAPAADPAWMVRLAFVTALALPWVVGAGLFRKPREA